ncbi:MAG: hypothetical protein L0Y54_05120 [Sporichthyaceae bacterium]|nr:hypothetical protein [Sporichthyaceae bacterium]
MTAEHLTAQVAGPGVATPTWRVLLSYARPHRVALLAGGLLSVATTVTGLALPLIRSGRIHEGERHDNHDRLGLV